MLRSVLFLFVILAATPAMAQDTSADRRAVLDAFFAAFNAQDADAMGDLVTEDVQIVYLGLAGVDSRVDGADRMVRSMRRYFSDLPSARSEILSVIEDGNRLAVRERASWTTSSGEARSQTALAVYRIRGGVIAAVWYFPATVEAP
ncbi:nuclear transport factor 2 family protein [Hyphobacterium marinum]|uniref:Nuclear transport factor 2 family protein n=1 Tax=Hyphobacterium marinum TaxID=3116574 RepID=A0ABU7LXA7_9PROT|nr:nuclear transport factor 2 family protein [Hyphobacterium sp. Y6023]MEE2566188.1 nuclear transport factor 2 family protein [Hyphobacterium sp. Y6023]